MNALAAARYLLIPIQCEYYALEGLGVMDEAGPAAWCRAGPIPGLAIEGIVMTMYDTRTNLARQVDRGGGEALRRPGVRDPDPAHACAWAKRPVTASRSSTTIPAARPPTPTTPWPRSSSHGGRRSRRTPSRPHRPRYRHPQAPRRKPASGRWSHARPMAYVQPFQGWRCGMPDCGGGTPVRGWDPRLWGRTPTGCRSSAPTPTGLDPVVRFR